MPVEVPGLVGPPPYTRRHAIPAHRRLAARHDPPLPGGRGAAALFGCPADAVAGLGALAERTGAEFVVVAGDVFDANQLAPTVVSQSLEAMRAIGVPVYLLPGNHDPLDAASVYTQRAVRAECPDPRRRPDRAGCGTCARVCNWWPRPGARRCRPAIWSPGPGRPARRRDRPRPGRPRWRRRPGPGSGKPSLIRMTALAEALGAAPCTMWPWGQALPDLCRGQRPRLVLRVAGGDQL